MKKLSIDSRPSDALGIAARLRCPLFISEAIVDEAGVAINLITEEDSETEVPSETELERDRLEEELQKAIDEENYEEAARIRDRMKEL
jgi:hypothetical protein